MVGFLALFVGLLAAGMPVFLVLGLCAGAMFTISGQPLVGFAQLVVNELNSPTLMALPLFVMAAAMRWWISRLRGSGDFRGPSASSPSSPAPCLRQSAARASRPRSPWGPF